MDGQDASFIQARSRSGRSAGWPDLKLMGRWVSSASLACARRRTSSIRWWISPGKNVSSGLLWWAGGEASSLGVVCVVKRGHRLLDHPVVVGAGEVVEDL